jgi:hypothetical protein
MYVCQNCQQPINQASARCPYCGADQAEPDDAADAKPEKKSSATKLALFTLFAIAAIWGIIWFALPLRIENPRPAAERDAVSALRTISQQLAAYANGAGNFPQSLESLGDPARDAADEAMTGGYSLHYTPQKPDADGNFHAFDLVAVPRNYGYRSFFIDQSGVMRATRNNRVATAQDPPLRNAEQ